jgi:CRP-like cAMP-binding protein
MLSFQPTFVSPTNGFLAALPSHEFQRLVPYLREVHLMPGDILFHPGQPAQDAFFLDNGLVSLSLQNSGQDAVGLALAGRETVIGSHLILNKETVPLQATVQVGGIGWALASDALRREFKRNSSLQELVMEDVLAQQHQFAQNTLCYTLHKPAQRLASWLLGVHERTDLDQLPLSSCFLQHLAGDEARLHVALETLEAAGVVQYLAGEMHLLDVGQLEHCACECHARSLLVRARFRFFQQECTRLTRECENARVRCERLPLKRRPLRQRRRASRLDRQPAFR